MRADYFADRAGGDDVETFVLLTRSGRRLLAVALHLVVGDPELRLFLRQDKSAASLRRMADVMAKEKAQLWINHDKAQRDGQKLSPGFYE